MKSLNKKLLVILIFIFVITAGIVILINANLEKETSSSINNVISLEENPTTGFMWQYIIKNTNIVKVTSDTYTENTNNENIVGAGGIHTWYLEGLKQGSTLVEFDLYRPWEGIENSVDTIEFSVEVASDLKIEKITRIK